MDMASSWIHPSILRHLICVCTTYVAGRYDFSSSAYNKLALDLVKVQRLVQLLSTRANNVCQSKLRDSLSMNFRRAHFTLPQCYT